jgi:dTDP-4-amino-4,6-dideoxygalactose transaminase
MKVPLLDLKIQYQTIKEEVDRAIREVVESQYFILGPKVEELETKVAAYCGCSYAVGVSSGTDALLISLMTMGVETGDIVLTTPYTFFATAGAIVRAGAQPKFVDIKEDTYNMDPTLLEAAVSSMDERERSRVKAVLPIHLYGQCAEMEPLMEVAQNYGLTVIEDAAQAIGSEYEFKDGTVKRAGSMGHYGCFSFFPSKNLGAFGDAGMVTTDDEQTYERLRVMRVHGSKPKYHHKTIGGNFRLDALQAAVLGVKFGHLDGWTQQRRENAEKYREMLSGAGLKDLLLLPEDLEKRHIYNQFVIRVRERRDELRAFLAEKGVGSEVYYPIPLHMQPCFAHLGYRPEDFPVSAEAAKKTLALPIYPELTLDQIGYVVDMIKEFFSKA